MAELLIATGNESEAARNHPLARAFRGMSLALGCLHMQLLGVDRLGSFAVVGFIPGIDAFYSGFTP
jgi:hypothetical protein